MLETLPQQRLSTTKNVELTAVKRVVSPARELQHPDPLRSELAAVDFPPRDFSPRDFPSQEALLNSSAPASSIASSSAPISSGPGLEAAGADASLGGGGLGLDLGITALLVGFIGSGLKRIFSCLYGKK